MNYLRNSNSRKVIVTENKIFWIWYKSYIINKTHFQTETVISITYFLFEDVVIFLMWDRFKLKYVVVFRLLARFNDTTAIINLQKNIHEVAWVEGHHGSLTPTCSLVGHFLSLITSWALPRECLTINSFHLPIKNIPDTRINRASRSSQYELWWVEDWAVLGGGSEGTLQHCATFPGGSLSWASTNCSDYISLHPVLSEVCLSFCLCHQDVWTKIHGVSNLLYVNLACLLNLCFTAFLT